MEPIPRLNLAKYAKVLLIIATAISITAAVCLSVASCKSLNCTTFLIQHKPATILISIINKYVFLIRKDFLGQQQTEGLVAVLPKKIWKKIQHCLFSSTSLCLSNFLCVLSYRNGSPEHPPGLIFNRSNETYLVFDLMLSCWWNDRLYKLLNE